MSEQEDDKRRRHWLAVQNELNPGESEIERTMDTLATIKAGWYRVRNEKGTWAYFPSVAHHPQGSTEQRAAENAWERRAIQMHENQTPIRLAPKPRENAMTRITRGN